MMMSLERLPVRHGQVMLQAYLISAEFRLLVQESVRTWDVSRASAPLHV
jgi:hypothetical protein